MFYRAEKLVLQSLFGVLIIRRVPSEMKVFEVFKKVAAQPKSYPTRLRPEGSHTALTAEQNVV
jgi:hypothetical protein